MKEIIRKNVSLQDGLAHLDKTQREIRRGQNSRELLVPLNSSTLSDKLPEAVWAAKPAQRHW